MTISVFAVEDTAAQLTWDALPAPEVSIEVGAAVAAVSAPPPAWLYRVGRAPRPLKADGVGGPGALTVEGLAPATTYDVCVAGPGLPRRRVARLRTLAPPPGQLLTKLATVSDLHIGEGHFGALGTIEDRIPPAGDDGALPGGWEPHPLRCARAAMAEAAGWGADLLVVKGDLTSDSEPAEFHEVGRLLAAAPLAVVACLGNHDVRHRVAGADILAEHGVTVAAGPAAYDRPGVRVVVGHSPRPRRKRGHVGDDQRSGLARLVAGAGAGAGGGALGGGAGAGGGALVFLHHQVELSYWRRAYPPGLPAQDALPLLRALAAANPRTLVSGGHTHRCRRSRYGPLVITQVGSTKDYPGVWAGYAVHEGGIRQVVRRVADPSSLAWTEATANALGGLWGRWAAGRLGDRCFTHPWPPAGGGEP